MAKGDRVEIGVRGSAQRVAEATQNGRRIDVSTDKEGGVQFLVATELTRGGTIVRKVMVPVTEVTYLEVNQKET